MTDAPRPDEQPQQPDEQLGRDEEHVGHQGQGEAGAHASAEPGGSDEFDVQVPDDASELTDGPTGGATDGGATPEGDLAASYLEDLRRLQAEYVNYKRRVDRDRALATDAGVRSVLEALIPALDDIHLAREHGDLEGTPFERISDKLESALGRFGVERLGEPGVAFDPAVHEALMHVEAELPEGAESTTVVAVLQPGWKVGDRVVRPARVSVADPH
ncbi:nucleotide exchange factor GrpE [Lapillicoccus jejuensis]|uniref:Protein GrpE n=1 Tax=Lapillicoccus jejuensis TaxID=402171 RepID=A0A542E018_9MICO|nr:nucleotide exchange factor GrpE [Lapillicoccus jejuensis]TQJ08668.1 molecular chaperone GrpE [Lapillicoccus jejuensis]